MYVDVGVSFHAGHFLDGFSNIFFSPCPAVVAIRCLCSWNHRWIHLGICLFGEDHLHARQLLLSEEPHEANKLLTSDVGVLKQPKKIVHKKTIVKKLSRSEMPTYKILQTI